MSLRVLFVLFLLVYVTACSTTNKKAAVTEPSHETRVIYLVRHAEKIKADHNDPKLSPKGQSRAIALAELLKDVELDGIYSTKYKRTQMTASPLAQLKNLEINTYSIPPELFAKKLTSLHKEQTIVVVGHSNTIPQIIKALGIKDELRINHDQYGDLFMVKQVANKLTLTVSQFGN